MSEASREVANLFIGVTVQVFKIVNKQACKKVGSYSKLRTYYKSLRAQGKCI